VGAGTPAMQGHFSGVAFNSGTFVTNGGPLLVNASVGVNRIAECRVYVNGNPIETYESTAFFGDFRFGFSIDYGITVSSRASLNHVFDGVPAGTHTVYTFCSSDPQQVSNGLMSIIELPRR
jgi:hypothetical protein